MGNFNTEMYQALKLANVPEEQAIAAAAAVARGQDAATKSDLTEFEADLNSQMDIRFAEFRKEMNEQFNQIQQQFAEQRKENGERLSKNEPSLAVLKFVLILGGSAIIALLLKLVFPP